MMRGKRVAGRALLILAFGVIPAIICQFFDSPGSAKKIHIRNFRYGKDPSVIRTNRGDTLYLTFSSDDTGHSFFLEEFDMDVKVTPSSNEVAVFKTSDPSEDSYHTTQVTVVTRFKGLDNFIVSRVMYRCHVWCGPMHAFEHGKLVIWPNTLLIFSLGCLAGVIFIWLMGIFRVNRTDEHSPDNGSEMKEILTGRGIITRIVLSRWFQLAITIVAMTLIYIAVITSIFGTKMSGRNLGVLMMWAIWLFIIVAILTPLGGRIWCTICPLPFFGDWFQRRSLFFPSKGDSGKYYNKFYGLAYKWPALLSNNWPKLFFFMILATFSTTLVALPHVSGITILLLLLVPTIMAMIWELRAFCRYVCPVSVFVSPFSGISILALRNRSQTVCDRCKPHFCEKGGTNGWACPYGLNVGNIRENSECGLCMECLRSCSYNNVALYKRPFASECQTRSISEAWLKIAIFTIAIAYSIVYLGHWPAIRDYVNIIDKKNWDLFGIYSLVLWFLALIVFPAVIYLLSSVGRRWANIQISNREAFFKSSAVITPLGFTLWIAFVIPMLFVNITYIIQSFSDPFGWGWDFFGTAGIPWHQFIPEYIPWLQSIAILAGFYLSLRNLTMVWKENNLKTGSLLKASLPVALFLTTVSVYMIFFHTN
jgi:polyferredoxin